ncbi:MAG: GDSL-type esterase/lipase family protein [Huintestinicola sp.]|uniref:SGNH/GDSL hydrolase family protein n=1 Tax=Huintestinicola sp. TaxID=2981661 RepID=UPI003F0A56FB
MKNFLIIPLMIGVLALSSCYSENADRNGAMVTDAANDITETVKAVSETEKALPETVNAASEEVEAASTVTVSSAEVTLSENPETEHTEAAESTDDIIGGSYTEETGLSEFECYADAQHVKLSGRTLFRDNIRYLGYSCSAAEFDFYGTYAEIELIMEPEECDEKERSYYSVTVNSEEVFRGVLTEDMVFCAVDEEIADRYRVKITKLSEGCFGAVGIGRIRTVAAGETAPPPVSDIRIEFIGDSLTCGYGDEASSAEEKFSTSTENGLLGYAALTAERLGAEYNIIGMNGIGIVSRYTPNGEKKTEGFLMPELYKYTDGFRSDELWDNSEFVPDICVIALGANDNSYTRGITSREDEFSEKYIEFIRQVREANPDSYIICASGIQRSNLYDVIARSAEKYIEESSDERISSFRFNSQRDDEGFGSDYHPSAVSQQRFADELYAEITRLFPEYVNE